MSSSLREHYLLKNTNRNNMYSSCLVFILKEITILFLWLRFRFRFRFRFRYFYFFTLQIVDAWRGFDALPGKRTSVHFYVQEAAIRTVSIVIVCSILRKRNHQRNHQHGLAPFQSAGV